MPSPESFVCAEAVVVAVSRLRRRIRELSAPEDLTPSQRSVLSRLVKDGAATASALAAVERVRSQSMAATLAVLVELGFADRTEDPDDGRRRVVSATQEGRDWVLGAREARQEWLAEALETHCTASERETLAQAMTILERVAAT